MRFVDLGPGADTGMYTDLDFVGSDCGWVACIGSGVGGKLLHTRDGGATWSKLRVSGLQVDFVDERVGWLVGERRDRVLRTVDGGASWLPTRLEGSQLLDVCGVSSDEAWVIDTRLGLLRTTDAGETWQQVRHPLAEDERIYLDGLFALDGDHVWALGLRTGGALPLPAYVLRTSDGGRSWGVSPIGTVEIGGDAPCRLFFVDAMTGWAAPGGRSLLRTDDGGRTWIPIIPEVDGQAVDASYRDCSFLTREHGWAVGAARGQALAIETRDGGRTWRRAATGMEHIRDSCLTQVVLAGARDWWAIGCGGTAPSDFPVVREGQQVAFLLKYQPSRGTSQRRPTDPP